MLDENHTYCGTLEELKSVRAITSELDKNGDLVTIRKGIADLIEDCVYRAKDTDNTVALPHLINAVGSLTFNVNASKDTAANALYRCLSDIEKAKAALEGKAELFHLQLKSLENITYDFLLDALDAVRQLPQFKDRRYTR